MCWVISLRVFISPPILCFIFQGLRLPAASGCDAVEGVFVDRLGLTRTDAVALLGAHTIGRGDTEFSGHNGIWVDTVQQSTVSFNFPQGSYFLTFSMMMLINLSNT